MTLQSAKVQKLHANSCTLSNLTFLYKNLVRQILFSVAASLQPITFPR